MAPDPMNAPHTAAFAATNLVPLLRALADPEGTGELSAEQAASIERVETNLAVFRDRESEPPRSRTLRISIRRSGSAKRAV